MSGGAVMALLPAVAAIGDLPEVRIDRDDVRVTASCRLVFAADPIADVNGDGVVHVEGDGLVVDLGGGTLAGSAADAEPWARAGTGITVRGKDVTLRNGAVRGFRVGVLVREADGFTAEDLDLSSNWGARLKSTSAAEDGADWLWPHTNDGQEWRTRYGAALCVERSKECTIRRVRAVGGGAQNGLMLDRVDDSKVYDCDASFLSGWGLSMWRSSRNVIARNSFDFCVRGYSHGVYNRGQDSAGILMFEQCSDNLVAGNSITHGGDGIFVFAGTEALGPDVTGAEGDAAAIERARGAGCNRNRFIGNDCSFAVAHGIELTFSFENVIARNVLRECGISGTWGGYSRGTKFIGNTYDGNGSPENPGEEGGISTEHGARLLIEGNTFRNQGVGVKLWWDEDPPLLKKAWAHANGAECRDNRIVANTFEQCPVAIRIRQCDGSFIAGNAFANVATPIDARPPVDAAPGDAPARTSPAPAPGAAPESEETDDPASHAASLERESLRTFEKIERDEALVLGTREPIGARAALSGRDKIMMTERGPYDWNGPLVVFDGSRDGTDSWRLLGPEPFRAVVLPGRSPLRLEGGADGAPIRVSAKEPGVVAPYALHVFVGERAEPIIVRGTIVSAKWDARFFAWTTDPRTNLEGWRHEAARGTAAELGAIDFRYGHGGPSQLEIADAVRDAALPKDRFGMIARTRVTLPAGRYRFRVLSDDGVRLRADGKTLIERWDWHAPTEDTATLVIDSPRAVDLEIEHFELDGFAVLSLAVERVDDRPGG